MPEAGDVRAYGTKDGSDLLQRQRANETSHGVVTVNVTREV